ncbi:MAG: diguanylate cyclase, partial [Pseudomonadota bacterium]
MSDTLKALIVDDSELDVMLLRRKLEKADFILDITHVDNAQDMRNVLTSANLPDIVISDYHMPGFSAEAALSIWHELELEIPFIVVSGAIGEEEAVDLMHRGAHDFVRKDNLARLIPAVHRELREAKERAERRAAEQQLRQAATIFENTAEGVVIADAKGRLINVNPAFTNITGYSSGEVVGKTSRFMRSKRHNKDFYRAIWDSLQVNGTWQGEIWTRHKSNVINPEWLTVSVVRDEQDTIVNYIGAITDISAVKRSEEQMAYLTHHDVLTKLPNRLLFNDRLEHALQRSHREDSMVGVIFLDLDRFKNINDSLGHQYGDRLLQMVARRLLMVVREGDTVARLGGDEFILIIENLSSASAAARVAQKLLGLFEHTYTIEGNEVFVSALLFSHCPKFRHTRYGYTEVK